MRGCFAVFAALKAIATRLFRANFGPADAAKPPGPRRRGDRAKAADVCFWHKADIAMTPTDVRFRG
jgi:hypothetical protein